MYVLIAYSRWIKLAPKWYGLFKAVKQIHLIYDIEVYNKNGTKLVKYTTRENIHRAERSAQKIDMIIVKMITTKTLMYQII